MCEKLGREAPKNTDLGTAIRSFFPDVVGKQETAWCKEKATPILQNVHGAF